MEFYLSQVFIMATNFAPRGSALCNGQLVAISQNTALFSLLGTIYGGDGRTSFAYPELRGRTPIHAGNGPGLPDFRLGARSGQSQIHLNTTNIPSHTHHAIMKVGPGTATVDVADGNYLAHESRGGADVSAIYTTGLGNNPQSMANNAIQVTNTGGSQPYDNYQPYLALNYCLATVGIFPSRS